MAKEPVKGSEEGGKKGKKKLLIIIIVVLVMLIGGGVGAFLFLKGGGMEDKISPEEEQAQLAAQAQQVGPMVNIDSFIVNIIDSEESRYLKAAITLEVDSDAASQELSSACRRSRMQFCCWSATKPTQN